MRSLDQMIMKELGELINKKKEENGYQKVIVQTWDLWVNMAVRNSERLYAKGAMTKETHNWQVFTIWEYV